MSEAGAAPKVFERLAVIFERLEVTSEGLFFGPPIGELESLRTVAGRLETTSESLSEDPSIADFEALTAVVGRWEITSAGLSEDPLVTRLEGLTLAAGSLEVSREAFKASRVTFGSKFSPFVPWVSERALISCRRLYRASNMPSAGFAPVNRSHSIPILAKLL